jgi:hypothetical protein
MSLTATFRIVSEGCRFVLDNSRRAADKEEAGAKRLVEGKSSHGMEKKW